jgi:hypothetical protein
MLAPAALDTATIDTVPAPVTEVTTDLSAPRADALPQPSVAPRPRWHLATRVAFRLSFLYFTLYVLTTQMLGGLLPFNWAGGLGGTALNRSGIIPWIGTHVFHIRYQYSFQTTGSGDRTVDYLQAFALLMVALAGTALWSVVDRHRPNYRALNKWFRLFLRFALGSTMLGYGMVKWIPLQMSAPSLQRLLEPYGNFSPMGVLWASIGASKGYEMFAGFMELTAAVLLFIPQLSLLGAMVAFADSVQIFTLNMTYDVPVKLFSFHLIVMSLVLIAPDAMRVARVLVLNRTAEPSQQPPLFRRRSLALVALAVQLGYGSYLLIDAYTGGLQGWFQRGGGAPKIALYGVWNIERMTIDGETRSALVTDYVRWRRVLLQNAAGITFQRMDDTFLSYGAKTDMAARTIALTTGPAAPGQSAPAQTFTFERPHPERLVLDGTLDGHKIHMETRRFDPGKFPLLSRGFNWIQERPFNR